MGGFKTDVNLIDLYAFNQNSWWQCPGTTFVPWRERNGILLTKYSKKFEISCFSDTILEPRRRIVSCRTKVEVSPVFKLSLLGIYMVWNFIKPSAILFRVMITVTYIHSIHSILKYTKIYNECTWNTRNFQNFMFVLCLVNFKILAYLKVSKRNM